MKVCTQCRQTKEESQFGRYGSSKDKLRSYCKACANAYMKRYMNETGKGRFRRLKKNSFQDKVPVNMTETEFVEWFNRQEMKCHYCKAQLEFVYGRHWNWNGLTIDRVNPQIGYTIDNIVLACRRCNIIKGHWFTKDQMLEIATKYLRG